MLKKAFKTKKVDLAQHTEDFLRAVLVVDQAERIGWRDVLKHPVFSLIDN